MSSPRLLPIYGGRDGGVRPHVREAVFEALTAGAPASELAVDTGRRLDAMWAEYAEMGSPGGAPACGRGCFYCCHQRVDVTAPEVFALAAHVRASFDAPARADLDARLSAARAALAGLSSREHHLRRVRCALLSEERDCRVHEARPLACRHVQSLEQGVCRAVYDDPALAAEIPASTTLRWNTASLVLGYREGFEHAGRPLDTYELNAALALALAGDEVETAWSQGADPLASARTHTAGEVRTLLG